jgi:hypothetical protein
MRDDARANGHSRAGRKSLNRSRSGESASVSVRLPDETYDALYALASDQGLEVSALIRDAIEDRLADPRKSR